MRTARTIVSPSTSSSSPSAMRCWLVPLPAAYFYWLAATLLSYCLLTQLIKAWYIRRYRIWL